MPVYCTAPWNGLTVREDGKVKTCCVGGTTLGNLNSTSIEDIEQSSLLKDIRTQMLAGQLDVNNCRECINLEKQSGLAPLKEHYNKYYSKFDTDNLQLKFLDIRWNNLCNLACSYCTPDLSSTWGRRLNVKPYGLVKEYQDDLLAWVLKKVDTIEELMLVGGEPLLMKQNYELLARLPDNCKISIITNLSYDLENLPCINDLLRGSPGRIAWNISAENTHAQFEYVRSGANWLQFEKNLNFIKQHWPDSASVNIVYSMFSAFNLTDTIKIFSNYGIKKFNFMSITDNPTMDLFNMPGPIKQRAKQELTSAMAWHIQSLHPEDRHLYPMQGADQLLASLDNPDTHVVSLSDFDKKIQWYNSWATVPFNMLWPEVVHLTKNHLSI